jgi:hypothetical protein
LASAEAGADGRRPLPAGPAMAGHPAGQAGQAGQHVPSRNGVGHAPGLLHANGHGDGDQTAHTGPSAQGGWDR